VCSTAVPRLILRKDVVLMLQKFEPLCNLPRLLTLTGACIFPSRTYYFGLVGGGLVSATVCQREPPKQLIVICICPFQCFTRVTRDSVRLCAGHGHGRGHLCSGWKGSNLTTLRAKQSKFREIQKKIPNIPSYSELLRHDHSQIARSNSIQMPTSRDLAQPPPDATRDSSSRSKSQHLIKEIRIPIVAAASRDFPTIMTLFRVRQPCDQPYST
jgi:hypothetical protein